MAARTLKNFIQHYFHKQGSWLALILCSFYSTAYSQLSIQSPVNNQVMQRDTAGFATLPVTAYARFPYIKIKASLTPIEGNVYQPKEWLFEEDQLLQGFLTNSFKLKTGWYKLTLTGYTDLGITDSVTVPRVGVGEVFLIAGNSNAMGLPGLGSKDASDNVVSFNAVNKTLNAENITVAPDGPMPLPTFSPLKKDHAIFPSGEVSWYWAELGDMLSKKWHVPVLFFNAAWAAANAENYADTSSGKDALNIYVGKTWPNRQPYSNIVNAIRYLTSQTGIRAIFWSHGENDGQLKVTEDDYFNDIKTLIENSRKDTGYNIPWFIAQNSASNQLKGIYQPVLNAQARLAAIKNFNTFKGPYLDTIQMPRPSSEHFENITGGIQGLTLAATAWNRVLPDSLLKKVIPTLPGFDIHTGITPARLFPGATFQLPYFFSGDLAEKTEIQAELHRNDGNYVATVGKGITSPIQINIPETLENGSYKVRLSATKPVLPGNATDSFYVNRIYDRIEFVNKIAARLIGDNIHISWLLANDPTLTNIILQKTTDGVNYADLQTFAEPQNQSQVYRYTDQNLGEKAIFYRLRLEHQNAKVTYSTVVTIFQNGGPEALTAFPNPTFSEPNQQFYLKSKTGNPLQCALFDMTGKEHPIYISDREVIGLTVVKPQYRLPTGTYILRIQDGSEIETRRILFR
ncbi:sialate O-acetylesterase [Dyadobacter luticola]|uniref:T9SS type A sorting domain-containing protein n=1 Tax=Dyadobacter luticola TaxID=1979387 RepID=A0A5R9KWJ6_9BACT|nr:sialate O-acetylesterase [Dyadobacter luticola]TLV00469.1 T9SS type A sorting domain-containing protein [Dyadobacter luticola]